MRIELVAGTSNVVRFPVERRACPTLDLLRDIAPDVREVLQLVESFDLDYPGHDVRDVADAEMADYVVNHVRPEPGSERRTELEGLLAPLVVRGVQACRVAHDAALVASEVQQRLVNAQTDGGYWLAPMEERAERLTTDAARLLVQAHVQVEQAEGAARAIGIALRGETWTPFDLQAAADALFFPDRRTA